MVKSADVFIGTNKQKLLFILQSSKTHNKGSKPQKIKISSSSQAKTVNTHCPFELIRKFIKVRCKQVDSVEQFFIFRDRSDVKPNHFRCVLRSILKRIGLNPSLYGSHGFPAGRSKDLFQMGLSVESIKNWDDGDPMLYIHIFKQLIYLNISRLCGCTA